MIRILDIEQNEFGDETNDHHIVPKGILKYQGLENRHGFFLDIARSVITTHFNSINNPINLVTIPKQLHLHCHTDVYYMSVNFNFRITDKFSWRKSAVLNKLNAYRTVLIWLSTFVRK